ncbi:uncharacterized, partial [Tachysurus ichikawai]
LDNDGVDLLSKLLQVQNVAK